MLVALIVSAGLLSLVVSALQRPPAPARAVPTGRPAPLPTFSVSPTPVPNGPVSSFGFSAVDDPAIHRVVFFGGVDSYDDTWLWDGSRWSRVAPPASPPGRFLAAAAYDPATRMVLLFGGRLAAGRVVNDTWAWDGTTWHILDAGSNGPPGLGAQMAWDDATSQMVLVTASESATGGLTWIWTGSRWNQQTGGDLRTSPIAGQMAFDPISLALLFVSPLLPPTGVGATTWAWNGLTWRELSAIPPIATAGLAVDPGSGRLLLCSNPTAAAPTRLWSWNGSGWTPVRSSDLSLQLGVEVTDQDRGQFLVLGFTVAATQLAPQPLHVWSWGLRGWRQPDVAKA